MFGVKFWEVFVFIVIGCGKGIECSDCWWYFMIKFLVMFYIGWLSK